MTLPARTPSTSAAARSTSSGKTLRPPTMIMSLSRPQTTSSPSARYARSPVRSHPSSRHGVGGNRVAVVPGVTDGLRSCELADGPFRKRGPVAGLDDPQLESSGGLRAVRRSAGSFGVTRRATRALERAPVDDVDAEARAEPRETSQSVASAMPNTQERPWRRPVRRARRAERTTASGSTGSAPLRARRTTTGRAPSRGAKRRRGRTRSWGRPCHAPEPRDPLQPPPATLRKSCGAPSTRSRPFSIRGHEQPDQAHVVVQRQPRHRPVRRPDAGSFDDRVDVATMQRSGRITRLTPRWISS